MTPLFASLFEEVIFWAFFSANLVVLIWLGRGQRRQSSRESEKKRENDDAIIGLGLLSIVVVTLVLGYARIGVLPSWLFYPGLALAIIGDVIALWARSILGRFWSGRPRVLADHEVIDKGPYHYIRHPMYTGQLLLYIGGLGLALQSWAAILYILIVFGIAYSNRIRIEEKLLSAELGNDYVDYMKRTKRLIPFLL